MAVGDRPTGAEEHEYGIWITVVPEAASGPVGRSHTVTATPHYQEGPGLFITFEVIAGPNAGASSAQGGCQPATCYSDFQSSVSWSYSGRRPGTDVIEACATSGQSFPREIFDCERVTMTWVDGGFPLGGNIADQARENRERVAAAAQPPAVTAPGTGTGIVTPPRTGDGGLASPRDSAEAPLAAMAAAIAVGGLAGATVLRRRGS
jgi:hypothetical protein